MVFNTNQGYVLQWIFLDSSMTVTFSTLRYMHMRKLCWTSQLNLADTIQLVKEHMYSNFVTTGNVNT